MARVLLTGARAPVTLHLARLFADDGHDVFLADTLRAPLARHSNACSRYIILPEPNSSPHAFADEIERLIKTEKLTHIIPTCEEVFYIAWACETRSISIKFASSDFRSLAQAHNKLVFARAAHAAGLAPPDTISIKSATDLTNLRETASELVLKPAFSRFASNVLIKPTASELNKVSPSLAAPWVAQEFISGEELCAYAVADDGHVTALAAYRPIHRAGAGAGIYFDPIQDDAITSDVAAYVAATQWSGQISFDFRRDVTGRPRVLECNPRATSGAFFFGPGSCLANTLLNGSSARAVPTIRSPLMIPLAMLIYGLPKAIRRAEFIAWLRDYRGALNPLSWPGDNLPISAQPRAILELMKIATQSGSSLIEASTAGIAWNGGVIGDGHASANFSQ